MATAEPPSALGHPEHSCFNRAARGHDPRRTGRALRSRESGGLSHRLALRNITHRKHVAVYRKVARVNVRLYSASFGGTRRVADHRKQMSASVRIDGHRGKAEAVAENRTWPDRERLAVSRLAGVCPVCERPIEGGGYGSGRIADGLFCSLECYAVYWYPARSAGERPRSAGERGGA